MIHSGVFRGVPGQALLTLRVSPNRGTQKLGFTHRNRRSEPGPTLTPYRAPEPVDGNTERFRRKGLPLGVVPISVGGLPYIAMGKPVVSIGNYP